MINEIIINYSERMKKIYKKNVSPNEIEKFECVSVYHL